MRLLVDEALSWRVAEKLQDAGHDAIHVRDLGLVGAPDPVILQRALEDERVVISADTDFAMLLATHLASHPSFVLLRPAPDTLDEQVSALLANLPQLESDLVEGCVAVIEPTRIRVRPLPIEDVEESV